MNTGTASNAGSRRAVKRARGPTLPKVTLPKAVLIMAGILALGLTAGCGKKDSPDPPGPNPTYPKTYPTS